VRKNAKRCFVCRQPLDRSYIDNPGPMVVFATPGMLHSGLSLQIFKKWCVSENNMVYCALILYYLHRQITGLRLNLC